MEPALARTISRFNTRVTNRITGPLAPYLPGFGIVVHVGRRSGTRYETPVNVFRHGADFVIALTYGVQSDWLQNVLAAGGCELRTRGRRYALTAPELVHDETRRPATPLVRPILKLIGAADFVRLRRA